MTKSFLLSTLSAAAITLASVNAFAAPVNTPGGNSVFLKQVGSRNDANLTQSPTNAASQINVEQSGTDAKALVFQTDSHQSVTKLNQSGDDEQTNIIQSGEHNMNDVLQVGNNEKLEIFQGGIENNANVTQSGSFNRANIAQQGTMDKAKLEQGGDGNNATITQGSLYRGAAGG